MLAAMLLAGAAHAQIPEKFTNLKILPADIPRRELINTMRNIAGNLGVRCNYCHPGGNPQTLEGVDFPSDSLNTKRVARRMLEMVRSVNQTTLAEVQPDTARRIELTCFTCHRGVARPEPLERLVARSAGERGLDSAVAEYRRLRETYYGRASYDFGERTLVRSAELLGTSRSVEALGLLTLNLEYFPNSAETYATMGLLHVSRADTSAAITAFRRAQELAPDHPLPRQQLQRLGAGR
jgi:tetratricopeptide (TPR) repeat protein